MNERTERLKSLNTTFKVWNPVCYWVSTQEQIKRINNLKLLPQ